MDYIYLYYTIEKERKTHGRILELIDHHKVKIFNVLVTVLSLTGIGEIP